MYKINNSEENTNKNMGENNMNNFVFTAIDSVNEILKEKGLNYKFNLHEKFDSFIEGKFYKDCEITKIEKETFTNTFVITVEITNNYHTDIFNLYLSTMLHFYKSIINRNNNKNIFNYSMRAAWIPFELFVQAIKNSDVIQKENLKEKNKSKEENKIKNNFINKSNINLNEKFKVSSKKKANNEIDSENIKKLYEKNNNDIIYFYSPICKKLVKTCLYNSTLKVINPDDTFYLSVKNSSILPDDVKNIICKTINNIGINTFNNEWYFDPNTIGKDSYIIKFDELLQNNIKKFISIISNNEDPAPNNICHFYSFNTKNKEIHLINDNNKCLIISLDENDIKGNSNIKIEKV